MEHIRESKAISVLKHVFLILVLAIFAYFLFGQFYFFNEQELGNGEYRALNEGWVRIKPDGTRESVEIPGKCDAQRNEVVIIENVLPLDVEDNVFL